MIARERGRRDLRDVLRIDPRDPARPERQHDHAPFDQRTLAVHHRREERRLQHGRCDGRDRQAAFDRAVVAVQPRIEPRDRDVRDLHDPLDPSRFRGFDRVRFQHYLFAHRRRHEEEAGRARERRRERLGIGKVSDDRTVDRTGRRTKPRASTPWSAGRAARDPRSPAAPTTTTGTAAVSVRLATACTLSSAGDDRLDRRAAWLASAYARTPTRSRHRPRADTAARARVRAADRRGRRLAREPLGTSDVGNVRRRNVVQPVGRVAGGGARVAGDPARRRGRRRRGRVGRDAGRVPAHRTAPRPRRRGGDRPQPSVLRDVAGRHGRTAAHRAPELVHLRRRARVRRTSTGRSKAKPTANGSQIRSGKRRASCSRTTARS